MYVPKGNVTSYWTYSDVNTFGVLWGGLEFLTTPMINITDLNDVYGCNYIVWWGNDGKLASYKVLGYFSTEKSEFYDDQMGKPKSVTQTTFQPPRVA